MTLAITPNSFANGSNCAVPSIFTPFAPLNLPITSFIFSGTTKALQVIVLVPSYRSNITRNFPLFNSLESVLIISPSSATFPLSIPKSSTLTTCSLIFKERPRISGVVSCGSSGIGGTASCGVFSIVLPLLVTAFPVCSLLIGFELLF